jgi:hypothetical protein
LSIDFLVSAVSSGSSIPLSSANADLNMALATLEPELMQLELPLVSILLINE